MNIQCPNSCQTCPTDPPSIENFSSEDPDVDKFLARSYGGLQGVQIASGGIFVGGGPGGAPNPPPLGSNWDALVEVQTCDSVVSQEDAWLCAFDGWMQNQNNHYWPFPEGNTSGDLLSNRAQTCPEKCGGGPTNNFVVPPGVIFGANQAVLDAVAKYYACQLTLCGNAFQQYTVTCPDGTPFTFGVAAGVFKYPTVAQANAVAASYAQQKAIENRMCFSALSDTNGCTGELFNSVFAVSISNTVGALALIPLTFTISGGDLPPGVILGSQTPLTGTLEGTPTTPGTYTFQVTGTNQSGISVTKEYTIIISGIVTGTELPDAESGVPYSQTLVAEGPLAVLQWALDVAGTLPTGLSLNTSTGEISGTPTDTSLFTYGFTITATFSNGSSCSKVFNITVQPEVCPEWETMIWNAPSFSTSGIGTVAGTFLNNTFDAEVSSPGGNPDSASIGCDNIDNLLAYDGGGCDCNLHVEIISKTGGVTEVIGDVRIFIMPATLIANVSITTNPVGIYDVAFSVPDTGGVPIQLYVTCDIASGGDAGIFTASGVHIQGNVTNL